MKPRIHSLQSLARISRPLVTPRITASRYITPERYRDVQLQSFAFSARSRLEEKHQYDYSSPNSRPANELNHNVTKEEQEDYDKRLRKELKDKQIRSPWNREGSDRPPVAQQREAGAMTKGNVVSMAR